ncbi:hypothetical protein PT7_3101 [Pusillimonas sp. T7-7]|nr:hypothetical protein PT7_3101 [Pusillimonas sp. T7-7]
MKRPCYVVEYIIGNHAGQTQARKACFTPPTGGAQLRA